MKRYIFIGIPILVVVIVILFYPGKYPYSLEVVGKIFPHKEWIITRSPNGILTSVLRDNTMGKFDSYFVTEFERGNPVSLNIHRSIVPGTYVAKGDTIGWIDSNEIERQIAELNGLLQSQKALLLVVSTGEKESMVLEAKRVLEHARETYDEHQKIVARLEKLSGSGFVPYQDYEIALSTQNLFMINIGIAEAQLKSVQSGLKQEEIEMVSSRITSLEEEIDTLLERNEKYTLTSPLSGVVFETTPGDTLVNIGDTSSYIVIIPVKLKSRNLINPVQKVKYTIEGFSDSFYGEILQLGNVVHILNGEQVLLVTASLIVQNQNLSKGTMTRCSIVCEPVTPRETLLRSVFSVFK